MTDLAAAFIQHCKDCDVQVLREGLVAKRHFRAMTREDSSAEVAASSLDTVANFDHCSIIADGRRGCDRTREDANVAILQGASDPCHPVAENHPASGTTASHPGSGRLDLSVAPSGSASVDNRARRSVSGSDWSRGGITTTVEVASVHAARRHDAPSGVAERLSFRLSFRLLAG